MRSPVRTIVTNRPEARNAVDPETADALVTAFEEFDRSDAKVGVFWGAGGAFCAGRDLNLGGVLVQTLAETPSC
jgi:enoyl-CoA hydratase